MKPTDEVIKAWASCYEFLSNTDGGEEVAAEADIVWDYFAAQGKNKPPPSTLDLPWEIAPSWASHGAVTAKGHVLWSNGLMRVEAAGWKADHPANRITNLGRMEIPLGYDWRLSHQPRPESEKESA